MLEVIFSVVMLFLALIGLIEFIRIVSLAIFRVKNNKEIMLVIPVFGHDEKVEITLRNAISKAKWFSDLDNRKLICLDFNMDEETRQICNIISDECEFLYVCTPDEFVESIKQEHLE